mmetsp:Transcript_17600/g.41502  ORF Transcript_17600/g.41502 Transcript_17600/m.41502 type:complete len:245 (+) Transcript_17600:2560-3294(+)
MLEVKEIAGPVDGTNVHGEASTVRRGHPGVQVREALSSEDPLVEHKRAEGIVDVLDSRGHLLPFFQVGGIGRGPGGTSFELQQRPGRGVVVQPESVVHQLVVQHSEVGLGKRLLARSGEPVLGPHVLGGLPGHRVHTAGSNVVHRDTILLGDLGNAEEHRVHDSVHRDVVTDQRGVGIHQLEHTETGRYKQSSSGTDSVDPSRHRLHKRGANDGGANDGHGNAVTVGSKQALGDCLAECVGVGV